MGNGVWRGMLASGEFLQHLIHLVSVDPSIHPAGAVRGHLPEAIFQGRDQGIVGDPLSEASCLLNVGNGDTVHALIVVDPQGGIPGLVVCPTVEGVLLRHGEGGSGHVCLCVVCILVGQQVSHGR